MADEALEDEALSPQGPEQFVRENPIAAIMDLLVAGILRGQLGIL